MDLQLNGRRVLVTGASKGIGLATAAAFLAEGAEVILVSRSEDRLATAMRSLGQGAPVTMVAADLSQASERERVASTVGDVDILVNNAGAIPGGGLTEISLEVWQQAWALKVFGYIHMTQLYLRRMRDKKAGTIVNIIGTAGRAPRYDYICGATGNAALIAFTSAVGGEASKHGVRVFGINPALTETDRVKTLLRARAKTALGDENRWQELQSGLPFDRMIDAAEIGRTAAFLASPACGYVAGTVLDVDGGGMFR